MRIARLLILAALVGGTAGLVGCAAAPAEPSTDPPPRASTRASTGTGTTVAAIAEGLVGTPYRYGGTTPRGFDCSGLVQYAYAQAGHELPRTSRDQFHNSLPVADSQLRPGDLLFFRIEGKLSHVGLYIGDGTFIHAPSSGKQVRYESLSSAYWRQRLVRAGRPEPLTRAP